MLHLVHALADSTAAGSGGGILGLVINTVVGAIAAGITALIKYGVTGGLDAKLAALFKKFQPFLALGLSAVLPALWKLLPQVGIPVPDVTALTSAPLATVIGVVIAELVAWLRTKYPEPAGS